jgi:hypothetical protein
MSQVSDVSIANQGFSAFRTELNNILGALNSMHSGTSRPSSATTGTIWLDTTNSGSNSLEIKFFDGSDDITFATVNTSANTINFSDSATDVVGDTTPQLGGNLDVNGNDIVSTSNANIDIVPNGTGDVTLQADTVQVGDSGANATITTNGTGDLILNTNAGTNSGNITIADGANGDISFTTNGTGEIVFNDSAYFPEATLTDASTIAWDVQSSPVAKVTLTDNRTLGAGSNAVAGQFVSLLVIQDGTGSRTLSFNAVYEFTEDTAPTLTTTASKGDLFVFRYNGSKFLEVGRNLNLTLS